MDLIQKHLIDNKIIKHFIIEQQFNVITVTVSSSKKKRDFMTQLQSKNDYLHSEIEYALAEKRPKIIAPYECEPLRYTVTHLE